MVDQKRSSSPSDYERKQAQLRAAYEEKQAEIAERKDHLLTQYGDQFEQTAEARGVDDEETRKLAADNLASKLAERNVTRLDLMDREDYSRLADEAIDKAYKTEELQRQQEAQNPSLEPSEATPEKSSGQLFEPATPEREAERDPLQQPAGAPERQAEAMPEREPERDPERQPIRSHGERPAGFYDELTREHADIVAKNSPQEQGQGQEQGQERQLKFSEDRQQKSPEIAGTQQQAEPGEKQLRFSEDRDPRDNSQDHNEERTDAKQAERQESGEKQLAFFEDRNPAQSHEMEH